MVYRRLSILVTVAACVLLSSCKDGSIWKTQELEAKIVQLSGTMTARPSQFDERIESTQILPDDINQSENPKSTGIVRLAVSDELLIYGIDPKAGSLAWESPPLKITTSKENQVVYRQDFTTVQVKDFLVAADITWNTSSSSSGCGFTLRTHGENRNLNRYLITMNRVSYGHIQFMALFAGIPANLRDLYAGGEDTKFTWENGRSNRLAIKAQGNLITVYLNHLLVGEIDAAEPPRAAPNLPPPPEEPPADATEEQIDAYENLHQAYRETLLKIQERYRLVADIFQKTNPTFESGYTGFAAVNHSGQTTCQFDNAWLWNIDPGKK